MIYDLQKASILKRISAWLLDFICLCIIVVGVMALFMVITKFDSKLKQLNENIEEYKVETGYDLNEIANKSDKEITQAEIDAYNKFWAPNSDGTPNENSVLYADIVTKVFWAISVGILIAYLIVDFVIPLIFKNGQTLGKKIFSIGVMQVTGVRITPAILFVRAILGKCIVETLIPVLLLMMIVLNIGNLITIIVIAAIVLFQLILIIATKTNSLIHDALSSTVTVDMATQMIFDNKDEMISYKENLSKAEAEKAEYK